MVNGSVDPQFEQVKAAFEANFDNHGEVGASLAIYQHGRQVVDLCGGTNPLVSTFRGF